MNRKLSTKSPLSYEICGIKLNIFEPRWQTQMQEEISAQERLNQWNEPHSHFTFEVFFVAEGRLTLVTDRDVMVYERKSVIVPPKLSHTSFWQSQLGVCLLFSFDAQQEGKDFRVQEMAAALSQNICAYALDDDAVDYVHKIVKTRENETLISEKEAELLIGLLFCKVIRQLLPDTAPEGLRKNNTKHINAIESFINANIYRKVTPADIADNVYLSVRQVSRIIAREYNCTLRQFIVEKNLELRKCL